ncbi:MULTISPECIES: TfoX/Sxy family protein [unclassified Modestobacter]
MSYDQDLADRVRAALSTDRGVTEKAMFGGLAFLVDGAMAVAVAGQDGLMVRSDPARADELTAADGVARMVMRGRELDGWLLVRADVLDDEDALRRWVATGRDVARSQPPRRAGSARRG